MTLEVTGCRYNDLRSGDKQWTVVLTNHSTGQYIEMYSPVEVQPGTKYRVVPA